MSNNNPDIVIVGAGIAGSSMAKALGRMGLTVTMVEKSVEHADRVRGEFIVPWGVAEARELELLDLLEGAGGNYTTRSVPYGEGISPEDAIASSLRLNTMVPGIRGALNLSHPRMCNVLNGAAEATGVTILRGIEKLRIQIGQRPIVEFEHHGARHRLTPRLVIGADGRGSLVARQTGLIYQTDPIHHILTGLLVDQVEDWVSDEQSIGVDGDVAFYVLPQGGGKLRLYIAHGLDQMTRFAGEGSSDRLIATMYRPSLPCGAALARARAIGPCRGYANSEVWIDSPVAPGVVLIGDAGGHSDPSGGQGISTAFNDVRLITEAIRVATEWTPEAFAPYIEQRRERTRRIRFSTRLLAHYRMEFTPEARERRARGRERIAMTPELGLPFLAMQKGPFSTPASAYTEAVWNQLLG